MAKRKHRAFLSRNVRGGRVYWSIRSTEKPRQCQLVRFGRCPEDPTEREQFLLRVRLAMLRYGIVEPIKSGIKPVRPLPDKTLIRRYASPARDQRWWNAGGTFTGDPCDVEEDDYDN